MYREIVGFNSTPEQIVAWWMGSPSHKAAMLDSRLTADGIGYVVPTSGPYRGWHLVVSNLAAYSTTVSPAAPAKAPLSPIAAKAASYRGGLGRATSAEVAGLKKPRLLPVLRGRLHPVLTGQRRPADKGRHPLGVG
ncbi:hypothetical protein ACOM2C_10770 [Pseudarthrobacter sp. So.54]